MEQTGLLAKDMRAGYEFATSAIVSFMLLLSCYDTDTPYRDVFIDSTWRNGVSDIGFSSRACVIYVLYLQLE
ncbi:hypothetical protein JHK82_013673 [Glycine max]|uniref:Uncharacterized protein n=2 Tax=Glycine subgen. Soja TaxID=1462606 RepID=A0A0R0K4A3_SOYBN|nr:hypothetical protein JHK87_013591 [Glycine soja]KAG5041571.1 hypothetical protein JHK85_014047 [Glycine max]KAG5058693.1 hypothetical protein JHK86_013689 [Glycine max]KAG5155704.1 hypothetical protein JHK82_013673 [Glycine max]KAH1135727.1 hypothetical protein GYH30_013446 [Glycine max]